MPPAFVLYPGFKEGMNIYSMYVANERAVPFWVTKWNSQVLLVTSVGTLRGRAPYYGNPTVTGELFSVYRENERTDTYSKIEERTVRSPGTYNWLWVEPTLEAQFEKPPGC
jgi:hypothetical protein